MTDLEAKKLLYILETAYVRRPEDKFSEAKTKLYTEMLSDLPYRAASEAVRRLIATSKWLPTIAEIRQACAELVDPLPSAEEAWIEACDAARDFTPYRASPELQARLGGPPRKSQSMSPLTRKAVAVMGGIEAIAYSDQPDFVGREFRRVYERLRDSEITARQQGQMLPERRLRALPGGDAS